MTLPSQAEGTLSAPAACSLLRVPSRTLKLNGQRTWTVADRTYLQNSRLKLMGAVCMSCD